MANLITYTVLTLGECKLHQLHTGNGKFFVMGEVAVQLFQETPTSFLQELRKGKYTRTNSSAPDVLHTIVQLGLQEAARLMAAGDYEAALPVAVEAVALGEQLFKPQPALQLFPLYLLAAQANLGLRRAVQCEKCLALASMLAMKEPNMTTNVMRSQLSRLYGQLYAFQSKAEEALQVFAEDVYYCSIEYGPQDARTSLGYYNLAKRRNMPFLVPQVLQSTGEVQGALSCADMVVSIWSSCLSRSVLGLQEDGQPLPPGAPMELPVGRLQLVEVAEMLQDICKLRADALGQQHPGAAAAHTAAGLALAELGDSDRAMQELQAAKSLLRQAAGAKQQLQLVEQAEKQVSCRGGR
ncbi:hypothetical protein OEZ86_006151 [Tetradesmus obliquus]|nr:hypothetical protein OEZ86_006151 [Tetradesmus obliquus]